MQLSDLKIIEELDSTSFPVVLNGSILITNANVTTGILSISFWPDVGKHVVNHCSLSLRSVCVKGVWL